MSHHKNKMKAKKKIALNKLIEKSDSDSDDSIHELSFYVNDRVKLMKEVLRIIKPKKIRSLAPNCMKDLDMEEINSMLLEELLGISNKRLRYIFNGQNLEEDSSSSDSDVKAVDIISLDDVSDDDFIIDLDSEPESSSKKSKRIKKEPKDKKIKKEKKEKDKTKKNSSEKNLTSNENLMSVLELLELQARARAIKSQLMLEESRKVEENKGDNQPKQTDNDDDDDVIIASPEPKEIVITSSDSEDEQNKSHDKIEQSNSNLNVEVQSAEVVSKTTLDQENDVLEKQGAISDSPKENLPPEKDTNTEKDAETANDEIHELSKTENIVDLSQIQLPRENVKSGNENDINKSIIDNDEIVINVEEEEMAGMINS